jgi:DNA gyrase subunit B
VAIEEGNVIECWDNGRASPWTSRSKAASLRWRSLHRPARRRQIRAAAATRSPAAFTARGRVVVNALSDWLEVQVYKNGNIYEMKFCRGEITQEMRVVGESMESGTQVRFHPDPQMFDEIDFDYAILRTRMREQAFLNAGLQICTSDERSAERPSQRFAIRAASASSSSIRTQTRRGQTQASICPGARGDSMAEEALQLSDSYTRRFSLLPTTPPTPEGGCSRLG